MTTCMRADVSVVPQSQLTRPLTDALVAPQGKADRLTHCGTTCLQAWEEHRLDTLKLVAQLRDVRNGKADQHSAHECLAWLFQQTPLTVVANLEELPKVR